jgi:8-oxo-dGTP pyrophosphatase MutT (NUDIX family)
MIEPGETPDEGFVRELQEELAWTPKRVDLYGAYPYPTRDGPQLIYVYSALVDVPFESLVLGEGQGMAYFAPDALPEGIVPDLRTLIERFAGSVAFESIRAS